MSKKIDLTGQRFGKLTVIEEAGKNKGRQYLWRCRCDCGKTSVVCGSSLRSGSTCSCGCVHVKHSGCTGGRSRLYNIWTTMRQRCNNPKCAAFPNYGGRGIAVCEEWQHDFVAFRDWALNNGYADNLSIDRIDNDKGYSSENCRWATRKQQNANRRLFKPNNGISVKCVETGAVYSSLCDAEKATGAPDAGISHCLRGEQKTAGGYHWERIKEK